MIGSAFNWNRVPMAMANDGRWLPPMAPFSRQVHFLQIFRSEEAIIIPLILCLECPTKELNLFQHEIELQMKMVNQAIFI